jgi:formate hydrogenlyase subunit 3/multisubunit Na+/H+ antiporter MnhD subunit
MNLVGMGLGTVVVAAAAAALVGATAPIRTRRLLVGLLTSLAGVGGLIAGGAAVTGRTYHLSVSFVLPFSKAELSVDALSGAFLLLIGGVALAAGLYGIGYTSPGGMHADAGAGTLSDRGDEGAAERAEPASQAPGGGPASRTAQATLPLFVAAMLLVPAAGNVTTLLVLWELMALTSLILVLGDHRTRPAVGEAGVWYAAMTHAGLVAILMALVVFSSGAGGESFPALRTGAATLSPGVRSLVFVLILLGFGSKAGMVPLHVWLPRAHPEAPSHVSALMSAAMVKLGLYGLIRVWFDLLGGGPRWWGVLVLGLGALSALYGVLQAMVATDFKRLLAYSTTENVGLMLMGLGAAGVFAAEGKRTAASLLLAAVMLHAVNHAGFKTLLFLGAGSVLRATGLRDLDRLGGLASRMPVTTALTAFGALAAAALPLGNGFVSEWLLLQGLIHSLTGHPGILVVITMPLAVGVVALTAGLGVATFVKAFGVGFLARPRSPAAAAAGESPISMRLGMGLAAVVCALLALIPEIAGRPLTRVIAVLPVVRDGAPLKGDLLSLRLARISGSMSPMLIAMALLGGSFVVAALARWLGRGLPRRTAPAWRCGGTQVTARMEYTATSFAQPLARVFDDLLRSERDLSITHPTESSYLISSVEFHQRVPDRLEARLYPPLLATAKRWGNWARLLQNGSVHCYLGYGLVGLLGLLVIVGTTR